MVPRVLTRPLHKLLCKGFFIDLGGYMAKLTVLKEINSAHGRNIHGHTFQIEITFSGKIENNCVANLDFHELEKEIEFVLSELDKTYIDDTIKMRGTIENIGIFILKKLSYLENLYSIKVWEGKDKNIEILKEEIE